jgi:hypothetical protein
VAAPVAEPAYDIGICTDQPECPSRGLVSWQPALNTGQAPLFKFSHLPTRSSSPGDSESTHLKTQLGQAPRPDPSNTLPTTPAYSVGGEVRFDSLRSASYHCSTSTPKRPQGPKPAHYKAKSVSRLAPLHPLSLLRLSSKQPQELKPG